MTAEEIRRVARTTARVAAASAAQREAITAAHEGGASTREIARAAGISHTQVRRILASTTTEGSTT
jgi:DNA invertase Pin-like site-specific DNA recombinase